jgi:hypothetical protein
MVALHYLDRCSDATAPAELVAHALQIVVPTSVTAPAWRLIPG